MSAETSQSTQAGYELRIEEATVVGPLSRQQLLDGLRQGWAQAAVENMHRIGGSSVENLRLKPREATLNPPGISLLHALSPQEAARQIREAFPAADELHTAAQVIGSTTIEKVRSTGFDIIPNPTRRLPHHYRLIHPDGVALPADTALRLSRYFGLSERFWIHLQARYDLETGKDRLAGRLDQAVRAYAAGAIQHHTEATSMPADSSRLADCPRPPARLPAVCPRAPKGRPRARDSQWR